MPDYFTQFGAGVLAMKIETYWKRLGFLGIQVERYLLPDTKDAYGIRSNIGPNGYPPVQEVAV